MENMEQRKEGAKGERKGGEGREKSLLHNFNVQAAAHGYALASHSPLLLCSSVHSPPTVGSH